MTENRIPAGVSAEAGPGHPDLAGRAGEAAGVLGWPGIVTGAVRIYGRRVVPVARLIPGAHLERVTRGLGPAVDKTMVAMWSWPESGRPAPPAAVELTGVIAPARHWRTGVMMGALFRSLCPVAVLLPRAEAVLAAGVISGGYRMGVAAVSGDAVDVLRDCPARSGAVLVDQRWVLEVVYGAVLARTTPREREAC